MIYKTEAELAKALPALAKEGGSLYCIKKGFDTGSSTKGAIQDEYVAYTTERDEAERLYDALKDLQATESAQPFNQRNRYFCSLRVLDLSSPVYAKFPECRRRTRIGFKSEVIYFNNYTQSPKMHRYMINIQNGVTIPYQRIVKNGLCACEPFEDTEDDEVVEEP